MSPHPPDRILWVAFVVWAMAFVAFFTWEIVR